jgi:hypothetical protein
VWRFLTYTIDVYSWVIQTTSTHHTVHFWDRKLKVLSTLHTHINTFIFKVLPIEAYAMFPMLSQILEASLELLNFRDPVQHNLSFNLIPAIFISGNRKSLEGLGHERSAREPPPCTLIVKVCWKEKPCDLAPRCNAEHSLFVIFHQSFLPNKTIFKGLGTPS